MSYNQLSASLSASPLPRLRHTHRSRALIHDALAILLGAAPNHPRPLPYFTGGIALCRAEAWTWIHGSPKSSPARRVRSQHLSCCSQLVLAEASRMFLDLEYIFFCGIGSLHHERWPFAVWFSHSSQFHRHPEFNSTQAVCQSTPLKLEDLPRI